MLSYTPRLSQAFRRARFDSFWGCDTSELERTCSDLEGAFTMPVLESFTFNDRADRTISVMSGVRGLVNEDEIFSVFSE